MVTHRVPSTCTALAAAALVSAIACAHPTTCDTAVEVCGQPTLSMAALGQEFELAPTGIASISGTALRVTFERVIGDSRCPLGAQCVWAGSAAVRVVVSDASVELWRGTLNSGQDPKSIVVQGYELALVSVTPDTRINVTIDPKDYRAKLKLSMRP